MYGPVAENQIEEKLENDVGSGVIVGFYKGLGFRDSIPIMESTGK